MNRNIPIKIIKYGLNLLGLTWILFITDLSYALSTGSPDCKQTPEIILFHALAISKFYLLFLVCSTAINLLIEWKLERKKTPREYFFILIGNLFALALILFMVSKLYRDSFCS